MANRYGMNMGNVLTTVSTLKTAKLRQKGLQNALDQDEADNLVGADLVGKNNPNSIVAAVDTNEDGEISQEEKKEARIKTGRKWNALSKEDTRQDIKKSRRQARNRANAAAHRSQVDWERKNMERERDRKSLIKITANTMGLSKDDATDIVNAKAKNFEKVYKIYEGNDKAQRNVIRSTVTKKASKMAGELEEYNALEKPEEKQAYADSKTKELQSQKMELLEEAAEIAKTDPDHAARLKKQADSMLPAWSEQAIGLELTTIHTQMKELDYLDGSSLTAAQRQTQNRSDRTSMSKMRKELRVIAKDYFSPPTNPLEEGFGEKAEFTKDEQRAIERKAQRYLSKMTEQDAFEKALTEARRGKKTMKPKANSGKRFVKNIKNSKTGEIVGYYSDGSIGKKQ